MRVLVDTGAWYAFCDLREHPDDREAIESLFASLEFFEVLVPWPVIYETVRTRFSKSRQSLARLEITLKKLKVSFIDDSIYREDAFRLVFNTSLRKTPPRPLSMVDCVLRLILDDPNVKVDKFATYNDGDFADVCRSRAIEIIK